MSEGRGMHQWMQYEDVGKFKVASLDDSGYRDALWGSRLALEVVEHDLTEEQEHRLQCKLLAKFIVLDWKGEIVSSSGNTVQYSPAWAEHLLRTNVDFFIWLLHAAKQVAGGAA